MEETSFKFNVENEIIKHLTPEAITQAMEYFSSNDDYELAGYFYKDKGKVQFKPFSNIGNKLEVELSVEEYKSFFENDNLLAFAHSHPGSESILPSQQDLNQVKYSIHDFLIFKPNNYKEFVFLGSEHDFSKSIGLVGETIKVKFN